MKPFKSKAQERKEIEQQTLLFLQSGGKVDAVERGASGTTIGNRKPLSTFSGGSRVDRTPLTAEIKAIEARRQSMRQGKKSVKPKRGPRRVLIKDDFGEPLRWSWQEDD